MDKARLRGLLHPVKLFHYCATWGGRLDPPFSPPTNAFCRVCVHFLDDYSALLLNVLPLTVYPSSQAAITAGLVPFFFSIGSDVACPTKSTPPQHPHICRDSARARGPPMKLRRNDNYDIRPLKRQEIVQLPYPLF